MGVTEPAISQRALNLDPWMIRGWLVFVRRGKGRSAFWDRRIGSVDVLIAPHPKGTGSETTSVVVQGHATVRR